MDQYEASKQIVLIKVYWFLRFTQDINIYTSYRILYTKRFIFNNHGKGKFLAVGVGDTDASLGAGDSSLGTGLSSLGAGDSSLWGTGDSARGEGEASLGAGEASLATGEASLGAGEASLGLGDGSGEADRWLCSSVSSIGETALTYKG